MSGRICKVQKSKLLQKTFIVMLIASQCFISKRPKSKTRKLVLGTSGSAKMLQIFAFYWGKILIKTTQISVYNFFAESSPFFKKKLQNWKKNQVTIPCTDSLHFDTNIFQFFSSKVSETPHRKKSNKQQQQKTKCEAKKNLFIQSNSSHA